jgi:large subunit ribosomal protein L25
MKEAVLETELRSHVKKSDLKILRSKGMIPAVFYGKNEKTQQLAVSVKKFKEIIHSGGANVLINLKLKEGSKTAIIKDVQRDIISQEPIHIDFQAISLKEKVQVSVPLHIVGIAPGVKLSGGILEHLMREVVIKCLPTEIPQKIDVDVSNLQIGNAILVKDLPKTEGVEMISNFGSIIVNVVSPTIIEEKPAEEAAAEAAAPTTAEPEVISKGKKDKEGEAAQPAAGSQGQAGSAPKAAGPAPAKPAGPAPTKK